jgi:hypothetical protein
MRGNFDMPFVVGLVLGLLLAGIVWFTAASASTPMRVPSGQPSVEDVR